MHPLTRLPLVFAVLALVCVPAYAQQPEFGVITKYDRFKDSTIYRVSVSLTPDRPGFVFFNAIATFKGQPTQKPRPSTVLISIESLTDEWYFLRTENVMRIICDGERLEIGKMQRTHSEVISADKILEQLAIVVPFSTVEKIARSKKVEMQVGRYEVEFKPVVIENIKAWVEGFK